MNAPAAATRQSVRAQTMSDTAAVVISLCCCGILVAALVWLVLDGGAGSEPAQQTLRNYSVPTGAWIRRRCSARQSIVGVPGGYEVDGGFVADARLGGGGGDGGCRLEQRDGAVYVNGRRQVLGDDGRWEDAD